MERQLTGRVALITGASSGIGRATAQLLAAEGAAVVLAARRTEQLEELVAAITQAGGHAIAVPGDVRIEEQAHTMVDRAVAAFGRLDLLINNAGVMLHARIEHNRADEWRQMVETNVLGVLYTTAVAIPHLAAGGQGHIVNISSVAGRKTRERSGVYSATKWGVNAISEALRQEVLGQHIRVTVIEPGAVATELASHITDEEALAAQQQSFGKMEPLQDSDIADAILWAVTRPARVSVNEVLIRPTEQAY